MKEILPLVSIIIPTYSRSEFIERFVLRCHTYTIEVIKNKYVVTSAISKVRNIGWDNSEASTDKFSAIIAQKHLTQMIDEQKTFDYYGNSKLIS